MLKKIAISLLLVLVAIVALLQFQRGQLEQQLTQTLHEQSVQFKQLSFDVFPSPRFQLTDFSVPLDQERSISGEFLQVDFALLPTLLGKGKIEQIQLTNGKIENWSALNLSLKPTALYVSDLSALRDYWQTGARDSDNAKWQYRFQLSARDSVDKQVQLNGHIQLNAKHQIAVDQAEVQVTMAVLKQPIRWQIQQATFTQFSPSLYQFSSQQNQLNGQDWGKLIGQLRLAEMGKGSEFLLQLANQQQLQLNWQNNSWLSLRSYRFPIEKLASAVGFPKLFTGEAALNLLLWQNAAGNPQGKFNVSIVNGELIGLNFAYLASNYLPLNFDEQSLSQANTAFQNLQMEWHWQGDQLALKRLNLTSNELNLSGTGVAELVNQQCDFNIYLGTTKAEFAQLKLPVHFWGNCTAPQYQIEVDSQLRQQLKRLIKQKLK